VALLVVVAAFAAVFLSVHTAQLSIEETGINRLRAEAAALAATHLTLWQLSTNADLQKSMARVVYEGDTSFSVDPLFHFQGDLAGATFDAAVWPGADNVRLKTTAVCGGVYFERWAHMPMQLTMNGNLLAGGDFEDASVIERWPLWTGESSLGKWLAGFGVSLIDNPRPWAWGARPWNITRDGGNHFAESLRRSNIMAQYIEAPGAAETLALDLDFIQTKGNLRVTVRGTDTLPGFGFLFPGTPAYRDWSQSGTVLYDSGNLPQADSWDHLATTVEVDTGYKYYVVQVSARGRLFGTPSTVQRAVDNITLATKH
jgi:hypothetical protein